MRTFSEAMKDDLTGRAAELAYYFFFSLFPALIATSALVGLAASSAKATSDRLLEYLGSVVPPVAFQMVVDTFNQTARASGGGKLTLGFVVALWSASSGTAAIRSALHFMYKAEDEQPYWKTTLESMVLTIAITGLIVLSLAALLFGDLSAAYLSRFMDVPMLLTILTRILAWPIAFAILAVVFALVYSMAPKGMRQEWRWISPGALIGIALWLSVSGALRIYLHFFNNYSVTYGSLSAVIVLLLWFYLSGLSLLLGAEINKVIEALAAERETPGAADASEQSRQAKTA
jgi:membrane protein